MLSKTHHSKDEIREAVSIITPHLPKDYSKLFHSSSHKHTLCPLLYLWRLSLLLWFRHKGIIFSFSSCREFKSNYQGEIFKGKSSFSLKLYQCSDLTGRKQPDDIRSFYSTLALFLLYCEGKSCHEDFYCRWVGDTVTSVFQWHFMTEDRMTD